MNNAHLYQLTFKEMKTMELKNQYNYEDDIHIENMAKTSGSSSGSSSGSNKKPSTMKSSRHKDLEKKIEEEVKKKMKEEEKEKIKKIRQEMAKKMKKEIDERLKIEKEKLEKQEKIKEDASKIWVLTGKLKVWNKNTKDWYKDGDGEQESLAYKSVLSTYFVIQNSTTYVKQEVEKNFGTYGGFILFMVQGDEIIVNTGGYDNNETCLGSENIQDLHIAANNLLADHDVFNLKSHWENICVAHGLWHSQTTEQKELFKKELVEMKVGTKNIFIVSDDEHGIFGV